MAQTAEVLRAWLNANGEGDVVHLWDRSTWAGSTSQVFKIFPAQRQHRLKFFAARLLGGASGKVPLHRNSSVRVVSCEVQSASLPGSVGPLVTFLRTTFYSDAGGPGHWR